MAETFRARCDEANRRNFERAMTRWLATLPAGDWRGTAADLNAALWASEQRHRQRTYLPAGSGLRKVLEAAAGHVRRQGFEVTFGKSKGRRLVRFTRTTATA